MTEDQYQHLLREHQFDDNMLIVIKTQWQMQQMAQSRIAVFREKTIKTTLNQYTQLPRIQHSRLQYLNTDKLMRVAAAIANLHDVLSECSLIDKQIRTTNDPRNF